MIEYYKLGMFELISEGEMGGPLVSDGIFQALEVKTSECETLKKQLADLVFYFDFIGISTS